MPVVSQCPAGSDAWTGLTAELLHLITNQYWLALRGGINVLALYGVLVLTQQGLCIRQSVSPGVGCACRQAFKALAVDERVKLFAQGLDQSKQVQRAVVM